MTAIPTGRFVWFEYLTGDAQKAQGFFGEVFGWTKQDMPIPTGGTYTMLAVDGEPLGGYPPVPAGAPAHSHWISHLQVADARATVAKIKSLGGSVKSEPVEMGMGTHAIVADPLGGVFSLWQPAKPEGTGDYRDKPGAFCWNELTSADPERSVEFYQAIGGFSVDKKDMGPMGTYYILTSDGKGRAGVAKPQMPGVPQAWLPYVLVGNADATIAKATKLGGKVYLPPMPVPEVGKIAIFADALGGTIGIVEPPAQAK